MEKEQQLNEIYEKLESGDISVSDAIRDSNHLTSEMAITHARNAAGQRTQEFFNDRDAEAATSKFFEDHPDYAEVVESGKLQPYIDKNPLLVDETLAYFQYKADQEFRAEGKVESKAPASFKEDKTEKPLSDDDLLNFHKLQTIEKIKNSRPTRREPITLKEIEEQQMSTLKKMRGE